MKTGKATIYSFYEGQALKRPNEVTLFLNNYLRTNVPEDKT